MEGRDGRVEGNRPPVKLLNEDKSTTKEGRKEEGKEGRKEGRKKEGRKEGRREARREGSKEGRKEYHCCPSRLRGFHSDLVLRSDRVRVHQGLHQCV
jgi:flagellar biosynthesis/type III secretory pathway protein FliH